MLKPVPGIMPIAKSDHEVLISVAFYHPRKHKKVQEFVCLGSQVLSELKDKLYCLNDRIFGGEERMSGLFFIENVFYNDMRGPNSIDYSKNVIEWVNQNQRYTQPNLGVFTSKDMSTTFFRELTVRLGQTYYYIHQGDCIHALIFTSVRLHNEHDEKNRLMYPLQTFQGKLKRRRCSICDINFSVWVTVDDILAEENPSFFCDGCYKKLHLTADGKPICENLKVFPYYHE
jgi:snRNA-activating protein complex subunit 3